MDDRYQYNMLILGKLCSIFTAFPNLRFTQLLSNLGLDKDLFYEEPDETLKKINKWINDYENEHSSC